MATNVIMPQMWESVAEGTVTKWLKKIGERVERDEPLFEISTDKVDAEIPSPAAGVLAQILVKESETVAVNTVVAVINGEGAAVVPPQAKAETVSSPSVPPPAPPAAAAAPPVGAGSVAPPTPPGEVRSSPLVRRIAEEYGVDLAQVHGTGLGGRVSKKDILDYVEQQSGAGQGAAAASQPSTCSTNSVRMSRP